MLAGCSIPVVHTLRVRVDRVRFPASRPKRTPGLPGVFLLRRRKYNVVMKLTTESRMDFDRTIGTEDRFALRRWLENYIDKLNNREVDLASLFADDCTIEGFGKEPLLPEIFSKMMYERNNHSNHLARYVDMRIKFKGYLYHVQGNYEEYIDGVLVTDGTMEFAITKEDDIFKIVQQKFFPRMMLAQEN